MFDMDMEGWGIAIGGAGVDDNAIAEHDCAATSKPSFSGKPTLPSACVGSGALGYGISHLLL